MPSTEKQPSGEVMPSADMNLSALITMEQPSEEVMPPSADKNLSGETWSAETLPSIMCPCHGYIRGKIHSLNISHPVFDIPDPNGAVLLLLLVSMLYALLTPWLLWRVANQPTAFIWTTSLVACSYLLFGTICLSGPMAFLSVFFKISCATLLAVAATHLTGHGNGAAICSMFTFYSAGVLGYAIGEYLQRVRFENSADIAAAIPIRDEEQQERREEGLCFTCLIMGTMSLCILVRMVWAIFFTEMSMDDGPLFIVAELSIEMGFLFWMWSIYVGALLEGAVASAETMCYKCYFGFFASHLLSIVLLIPKWNAAALLVHWAVSIAMVGFFGYCLAIHTRYKHIQTRKQSVVSADGKDQQALAAGEDACEKNKHVAAPELDEQRLEVSPASPCC